MIPIFIDTTELSEEFSLSSSDVGKMMNYVIKELTVEFARVWRSEAEKQLHQSKMNYVNSIIVVDAGPAQGAVVLVGKFPNMLEDGFGAFDMKEGFAKSEKRHIKEDGKGWYLTIPFRWATPDAVGESSVFSGQMPEEVHDIVKSQETTISIKGGLTSSGIKLSDLPTQYQEVRSRFGVGNIPESKVFEEYKNKNSIFEGIRKVTDDETKQNRYMSFRRVSDLSDPSSWVNSGVNAYNLAEKSLEVFDIPTIVDSRVDNFLNKLGF